MGALFGEIGSAVGKFVGQEASSVKRVLVVFATAATLAAGAAAVAVNLGLFSGTDTSIVTDKPRPPQIVITR